MNSSLLLCLALAAAGVAQSAAAETSSSAGSLPNGDPSLAEQVQVLRQNVAQIKNEYQKQIASLTAQMQRQQALIDSLTAKAGREQGSSAPPGPPSTQSAFPTSDDTLVGSEIATSGTGPKETSSARPSGGASASGSYLNISFDAVAAFAASTAANLSNLEVGDHDPQQRGFNLRSQELALSGAVDPYFEGFANVVFKMDNFNETEVELEEAFLQTTSLPPGLQARAGQFFAPFGRINPTHPHTWDFADTPLVVGRFLGPDGLRGAGAQVAWLAPWPWYSHFTVALQEGRGGTAYSFRNPGDEGGLFFNRPTIDRDTRSLADFVWVGRWENSVDLSPTQTVVLGGSLAQGPNNTGAASSTQLYGLDLFYKWKPRDAFGGWPFVKWQTEFFWRRYEAGRGANDAFPVTEVFHDRGLYTQLVYGFTKGWTAGLRADWLDNGNSPLTDDSMRQDRTRVSAALTWYPTEFSKLRLQFNRDWLRADSFHTADSANSIFLQTEFMLGAHGAHKF
ncbi:MAG: hypothetical protein WC378_08340 [Opitutaceae bacterium]|jgi:hypothetical protein